MNALRFPGRYGAKHLYTIRFMRVVELMIGMDITTYLRQRKRHLGEETKLIKDFAVFDFDHVPDEPLLRDEAKVLVTEMLRFEITGIPTHHFVIGSRGSGKTLTLRYLQRVTQAETAVNVLYANCRQQNTSFKILAHLLDVPPRGLSLAELFGMFRQQNDRKTIVMLDEIDLMSPKDKRREILYLLSRAAKPYMVIALSNNPHVLQEIDLATRSSLQPVPLHFRNYNADQIKLILDNRARQGLRSWDEGQLAKIAALTVRRTNADARVAIKTLYYVVTQPKAALDECFDRAQRDVVIDMITDLAEGTLMTLWSAATARTHFARDIYSRYRRFCQSRGDKPFSYVHFCSNLSFLQSACLVALVSTKVGRSYPNRVLLTVDQKVIEQVCKLRFEQH